MPANLPTRHRFPAGANDEIRSLCHAGGFSIVRHFRPVEMTVDAMIIILISISGDQDVQQSHDYDDYANIHSMLSHSQWVRIAFVCA